MAISIHVPSWGTTVYHVSHNNLVLFQSTFPRGERHLRHTICTHRIHFNPRSLVGNDVYPSYFYHQFHISIHVPSWGTTRPHDSLSDNSGISIHVPSWGTTAGASVIAYIIGISIHVPSWGTTKALEEAKAMVKISIHVPSWGTTNSRA